MDGVYGNHFGFLQKLPKTRWLKSFNTTYKKFRFCFDIGGVCGNFAFDKAEIKGIFTIHYLSGNFDSYRITAT